MVNKTNWTIEEDSFLLANYQQMTKPQMAIELNRTYIATADRLNKLRKNIYSYGTRHQRSKLHTTRYFLRQFEFTSDDVILDCFCGAGRVYNRFTKIGACVFTNDNNPAIDCDFHLDAKDFLHSFKGISNIKLIDLDPFGCCAPYIESALEIIEPGGGLIITDGFIGNKYCTDKRIQDDVKGVQSVYGFKSHKDINIDFVINSINVIAAKYNKSVTLSGYKNWSRLWRMYLIVK